MKTCEKSDLLRIVRIAAAIFNIIFILWIVRNGINERFTGTPIETASYISLICLLIFNAILLLKK